MGKAVVEEAAVLLADAPLMSALSSTSSLLFMRRHSSRSSRTSALSSLFLRSSSSLLARVVCHSLHFFSYSVFGILSRRLMK